MSDFLSRIAKFNAGRLPVPLALKYRKMAETPFGFFRGTCHLFHADWPQRSRLNKAPLVWLNGDLHLENFGTYRSDDRLTYFDIGDFDEGGLGPATRDLMRFVASLFTAAPELGLSTKTAGDLARKFLASYVKALQDGKARWIERRTAAGVIGSLLKDLEGRSQAQMLAKRTSGVGKKRRIRLDTGRALPISKAERDQVIAFMARYARKRVDPGFFRVIDVAQRVAGLGTLGLPRYIAVIEGAGGSAGQVLVDFKLQPGSVMMRHLHLRQPKFKSEAARVVAIEHRMQAADPAFLTAAKIGGRSFTFRELQPSQDKLELATLRGDAKGLRQVIERMAELVAWAQLRSAGRNGSVPIDGLAKWARDPSWQKPLIAAAQAYVKQNRAEWKLFRRSDLGKAD